MASPNPVILRSPLLRDAACGGSSGQGGRLQGRAAQIPPDAAGGADVSELGPLPEWDLADLYPGRDSPELTRDLTTLAEEAGAFRARYEGKLADLTGAQLGAAIVAYEGMQETGSRILSYAELLRAGNVADVEIGRFAQTMHEKINAVSTELLFFTLE